MSAKRARAGLLPHFADEESELQGGCQSPSLCDLCGDLRGPACSQPNKQMGLLHL